MLSRIPFLAVAFTSFGLVWGAPSFVAAQLKHPEPSAPRDPGERPGEGKAAERVRALQEKANSPSMRLSEIASQGDHAKVAALLKQGANPNETRHVGLTPLQQAASRGHLKVMRLLIDHGADVHASDNRGGTVLSHAATSAEPKALEMILEAGAKPNAVALAAASGSGRIDNVRRLLNEGVDANAGLLAAAEKGHAPILKLLLEKGADANTKELQQANSALHLAVSNGGLESMRVLLESGANPNATNKQGQTPLHRAVSISPPQLVTEQDVLDRIKLLVHSGAKMDIPDEAGLTPVRLAATRGEKQRYDWLVSSNGGTEPRPRRAEGAVNPQAAKSVRELLEVLGSANREEELAAQRELVLRGKQIMPEVLQSFDPTARRGRDYALFAAMGPQAEAAMPLLKAHLGDKAKVFMALRTIEHIKPGAVDELSDEDKNIAAASLYEAIVDPSVEPMMVGYYSARLIALGQDASPNILRLLQHSNGRLREIVAGLLASTPIADEHVDAELLKLARDEQEKLALRANAASALIRRGAFVNEAKAALLDVIKLALPRDLSAASRATRALASLGPEVIDDLIPLLSPIDRPGRGHAIVTLRTIGAPAVPRLMELLASEDESIAIAATLALERMSPHAMNHLANAVSGGNEPLADRAIDVLYRMGLSARNALPTLLEVAGADRRADAFRIGAARTALKIDPKCRDSKAILSTIPVLIRVLETGKFEHQAWAAEVAGMIGPPAREALPQLRKRLSLPDADADTGGLDRMHVAHLAAKAITAIEVPDVFFEP